MCGSSSAHQYAPGWGTWWCGPSRLIVPRFNAEEVLESIERFGHSQIRKQALVPGGFCFLF
jgi:hypothetical protein